MRKGKVKCKKKDLNNNKEYLKTIFKIFIPPCGTISIFSLINIFCEFVKPKLTVLSICIMLFFVLIICAIILVVCHDIIMYKKNKQQEQEQTKRIKYYLKCKQKILLEKERTKQIRIEKESNKQAEELPYDCKIYEMSRMHK